MHISRRVWPRVVLRWIPGIRGQLWLAVNVPLAVLVLCFLAYDYRRELMARLENKRVALENEAKTLLPAVQQIHRADPAKVQNYLDTVCAAMLDVQSPGHHIAVVLPDGIYHSAAHQDGPAEMLQLQETPTGKNGGNPALIVGGHRRDGSAAYVSERLDNVRRAVMVDIGRRLAGAGFLALVGFGALNAALFRVVTRPLERLISTVRDIGGGRLGAKTGPFASRELDYLAGEINTMSRSLAAADRERATQMKKAQQTQENLLPVRRELPGMRFEYSFRPLDGVGGDYVDALPLRDGTWLLCIADATGHGIPAALNAAMVKTLLLLAAERLNSPAEMLRFLNQRLLATSLVGDFVSMLLVRFHAQQHVLEAASAGHEPAWLMAPDGSLRKIAATGPLLGIMEEAGWADEAFEVLEGERLLMVTDGVTETMNSQKTCFGRARLVDLYTANRQRSLKDTLNTIEAETDIFRDGECQHDDVTVLIAEFGGFAQPAAGIRRRAGAHADAASMLRRPAMVENATNHVPERGGARNVVPY